MRDVSVLLICATNEKALIPQEALETCGATHIKVVYSFTDALNILKGRSYTVVVLDLNIKNSQINSAEFISTLRKGVKDYTHVQDIPIVVLAEGASKEDVERVRDSGGTEFIVYPFSIEHFSKTVRSAIESPRKFIATDHYSGPDRRRKKVPPPSGVERRKE